MIIERNIYSQINKVISGTEAIIITGMRRVGKTTLLQYIMKKLDSDNKLYFDLENPLNRRYFEDDNYENIINTFRILGLNLNNKCYIFLDEIQFVRSIPSIIKYCIDHHKIKFFLTGSASFYLKNLFSESLSGRKYIFELFPFSFNEFLKIKQSKLNTDFNNNFITEAIFDNLNNYYNEYIYFGGFPGVIVKESKQEKKMMLMDIFTSYFQLEISQLSDFHKINIIRDLILLLMERTGSKLDINKLSKELGIARVTLKEYISFLEHTYFISLIKPYSQNKTSEIKKVPKIYICDTGLLNSIVKISEGALFENAVYSSLKQKGEINYYQRKNGAEIDFILNKSIAYEVKNKPYIQDLNKLSVLTREINLSDYYIIARKYTGLEKVVYGFNL